MERSGGDSGAESPCERHSPPKNRRSYKNRSRDRRRIDRFTQNKMRNHDCAERQKQLHLTHLRDTPEGKPFVIKIEPDILTDCSDIQKSSRRPNGWWFNPEPVCGRVTPESKRFDRKRQRKHPADHLPASQLFGQDPSFRVAVRT